MIAGIFSMLVHTENYAIYTIIIYLAIITPILAYQPDRLEVRKEVAILDVVILGVSLIGPLLIFGAQLSSNSLHTSIYKIADGDGWDNAAHVSLLQLTDHFKGYIYPMANAQHKGSQVVNSYPQGWHLASSHIASGFGGAAYDSNSASAFRVLLTYVSTVYIWYIVSMYVFLKYATYIYGKTIKKLNILQIIPILITASLPLMLFVLFPSIHQGFVNYMAIIPFLILLTAATFQFTEGNRRDVLIGRRYVSLALPLLAAITLIWTLPAPAIALMCLYAVFVNKNIITTALSIKRLPILLGATTVILPSLVYAYILLKNIGFSAVYINTGYIAGFPRPALALILVAIILVGIHKKYITPTINHILIVVSPLTAYMLILWLLSYVKSGLIGYYQSKMFTLIVVLLMVFAVSVIMRLVIELSKHKDRYVSIVTSFFIGICIVGGVVILSDNPPNLNSLKRQLRGDEVLMEQAIDWAYRPAPLGSDQLLIFGDDLNYTHNKAMLFNALNVEVNTNLYIEKGDKDLSNNALKCVSVGMFYIGTVGSYTQPQALERLSHCLKLRLQEGMPTTIISTLSNKPLFEEIDTYDAKIEYIK